MENECYYDTVRTIGSLASIEATHHPSFALSSTELCQSPPLRQRLECAVKLDSTASRLYIALSRRLSSPRMTNCRCIRVRRNAHRTVALTVRFVLGLRSVCDRRLQEQCSLSNQGTSACALVLPYLVRTYSLPMHERRNYTTRCYKTSVTPLPVHRTQPGTSTSRDRLTRKTDEDKYM